MLWDRYNDKPVYVGTARNKGRIVAHLRKDSVRDGKIGLTYRNKDFFDYVNLQPTGWLGVTFELFDTKAMGIIYQSAIGRRLSTQYPVGTKRDRPKVWGGHSA